MARTRVVVTVKERDPARIPDSLAEGALLFHDLSGRGVVDQGAAHLRIRRQSGYSAIDVWLMLVLFLASAAEGGLRPFWAKVRSHAEKLAALAGRRRLPSPASVSRALDSVEADLLREATTWMLSEAPGCDAVFRHPAVLTYDAHGDGHHVFDLDPTVTTLRHRGLPTDDDLPEPKRRSEETGAPGHSGRKRGDLQYRRVDVQHAGSGLSVHAHLHAGNGEGVADLELALGSIAKLLERLEHPRDRALLRMDGEFGSIPYFTACREHGLPFVTRLNRHKLYEDPDILARMRQATWLRVPNSGSGPTRSAADLGVVTIRPGRKTRRPDGSTYEPLTLRVIASAFPKEGKAQRGRTLDGWQVELFVVDAPADAWPAPDAVATYFGRSGQENRFAQEDREVGLDRIVSYHLPGQELATLAGLFLLNYRIARGFELETPPAERPAPSLRRTEVDHRIPRGWPRDPVVNRLLEGLDWPALLGRLPGWRWESGSLHCPDGRELVLTTVRAEPHAPGRTSIIFRRPKGGCEECSSRESCFQSSRATASKHVEISISSDIAKELRARLIAIRHPARNPRRIKIEPIEVAPGLRAVLGPRFVPSEARRRYRELFLDATLRVEVEMPPPRPQRPRLVVADDAERQHRRLTWAQRHERNALPEDAVIRIEVAGSGDLQLLLATPEELSVRGGL